MFLFCSDFLEQEVEQQRFNKERELNLDSLYESHWGERSVSQIESESLIHNSVIK